MDQRRRPRGEDVINPATEKTLAQLPHASTADLDRALEAAEKGFAVWQGTAAYDRAKIMRKAADLLRERHDPIARRWCRSRARSIPKRAPRCSAVGRYHRVVRRRRPPRLRPHRAGPRQGRRQLVVQEPVGVVAAFTPWNFPTLTPARKIGGALAAGCSLIIKASEETPGACVEMVRCFADAGLPAGVLNLVFGVPADDLRAPDRQGCRAQDLIHRLDPGRQASWRRSPPRA